ncbi:PEBP family protein [Roseibium sp. AS2]|uniref:PEBP family protein n=1 Tax=Roseibium sp. AS2 TaxID=3135781 RepID=UPI003175B762
MRLKLAMLTSCVALASAAQAETFSADVWVDNWFSMSVDGQQVAEDSVPITTERSFNAESFIFEAERPFVVGLRMKDFKQNDTGLEYIGAPRQQMGDGGAIVQIHDADGALVAVSDSGWQCLVVHKAPLDTACADEADPVAGEGVCGFEITEEPEGWDTAEFDASDWTTATEHSAREVGPKDGYDEVDWDPSAKLIWGDDLKTDNTVLCRLTAE